MVYEALVLLLLCEAISYLVWCCGNMSLEDEVQKLAISLNRASFEPYSSLNRALIEPYLFCSWRRELGGGGREACEFPESGWKGPCGYEPLNYYSMPHTLVA